MDRQIYPTYAKIRLMRSKIKEFGTIVPKILSKICEDPTYANPTYARFTVLQIFVLLISISSFLDNHKNIGMNSLNLAQRAD